MRHENAGDLFAQGERALKRTPGVVAASVHFAAEPAVVLPLRGLRDPSDAQALAGRLGRLLWGPLCTIPAFWLSMSSEAWARSRTSQRSMRSKQRRGGW
ncbi:MAG: hypothetical protein C4313_10365 [Thermoflexus sp.]